MTGKYYYQTSLGTKGQMLGRCTRATSSGQVIMVNPEVHYYLSFPGLTEE
jgi:hypothetical protein